MLRRLIFSVVAALVGFVVLLVIEVQFAKRTPRIEEFPPAELSGRIGDGTQQPLRVVWIGDSTGSGVGASTIEHAVPRVIARGIALGLGRPVDLTVLARTGDRVQDAIRDQLPKLKDLRPDWIFVGIGGNDVTHLTKRKAFRTRIDLLLSAVGKADASQIIVLGIPEFAATPLLPQPLRYITGKRADQLASDVEAAAGKHQAVFVDIMRRTGPRFVDDPARYHAHDRFHPSDDGYALWAQATLDALREDNLLK